MIFRQGFVQRRFSGALLCLTLYVKMLLTVTIVTSQSDGGMHHSAEYMSIIYNLGILLYNQRM